MLQYGRQETSIALEPTPRPCALKCHAKSAEATSFYNDVLAFLENVSITDFRCEV
jgi:hypothetical protein